MGLFLLRSADLSGLQATRFAGNTLTGCVPNGLRYLVTLPEFEGLPAHDFIAVDANDDGDTDDPGDTPGLELPFCTLRALSLSGVTLEPVFASDAVVYTASADHDVTSTMVTATLHNNSDTVSIMKGADTSTTSVQLDVGPNVITVTVTTADLTPTPHTYTVTVTRAPNAPPAFDEGTTTTRGVDENTAAGRYIGNPVAATDTENDTLTYSLDATGAASFDIDASSGQLRTKAALDHETKSSYTVTVSVRDSKDGNGDADEATDDTIRVTILVTDMNEAPEFPMSEDGLRSVDENTVAGVNIGAPVAATDDDNDPLTYSLDAFGATLFDIVSTTGQLQTKASLDYETTGSYSVTVTASDPLSADRTITVTITVDNVDDGGTVTLSSTQPIVGSNLFSTLTDPDSSLSDIAWHWEGSQNGTSWTSLSSTAIGLIEDYYLPKAIDVGIYLRATASYTDGEGAGKSARAVSANRVLPAPTVPNEPPAFDESPAATRDVDENTSAGEDIGAPVTATDADNDTLTFSLDVTSRTTFDIVATTGQLQTKAALDFETGTNSYSVIVTATDTAAATDTITVTITVNNLDEPGTVTLSSPQPLVAIPLTAMLNDPDGVLGGATWSWARSPNGTSDWTPISGEVSATYTPLAADVGDYLRATASYTDGEGSGKSAQDVSENAVDLVPGRNAPVFREYPTATRSVPRNTPAGRNIGAPFTATDADNDLLIYSLGGPDGAGFDIVASSGQLLTKVVLTGINRTSYKVFVSVSDGKDDEGNPETNPVIDATTEVTITVTTTTTVTITTESRSSGGGSGGSSNRPPTVDGPRTIQYPEHGTEPVATYTAEDPEGTAITWQIEDTDAEHFRISEEGVLSFRKPPDYENPVDFRLNNTHEIRILAVDSGIPRASGRLQVRIEIKQVNEIGPIAGETELSAEENFSGTLAQYAAQDPEGDTIGWSLSGPDAAFFQIDEAGSLSLNESLDFESPASATGANDYSFNVVAIDDNRRPVSVELPITVAITNVNEGPVSIQEIPLQELTAGVAPKSLDLNEFFTDTDGDTLTYTLADEAESGVVSATLEEGILAFTPLEEGTASFDVTVLDTSGLSKTFTVSVSVVSPPPPPTPEPTPAPTPEPTPEPTPTPTSEPVPTPTATPTPIPTPGPTPTPTQAPTPTTTPTPIPTPSPTSLPTSPPTGTPTPSPSLSPTPTPLAITTPDPTLTATPAPSPTSEAARVEEPETPTASDREGIPAWVIVVIVLGVICATIGGAVYAYQKLRRP